jgi:3-oxoacyl-[acyl-carrier protein] reductase
MTKKLEGKVAVVTGASKGIGAEIALEFAREGAFVIVNYSSSKEGAEKIVSEIHKKGGKAVAIQANVSLPKDVTHLFKETIKAFGKLDILINNAGVYEFAPLEDITPEMYHKIFDLNVLGLLLTTQEAIKHFKGAGSIINISSVASTSAPPNSVIYSASKAAVDTITKVLGKEFGHKNIRVNSINPGMIDTEGTQTAGLIKSDFRKNTESQTPLGRIGRPSDIAPAAVYFASDDSAWVTGETIFISGGYS